MLRVQELCKERGITMQDLAVKLGVSYQALYASVAGNPSLKKINEIAEALGVNVRELFEDDSSVHGYLSKNGAITEVKSVNDVAKWLDDNG